MANVNIQMKAAKPAFDEASVPDVVNLAVRMQPAAHSAHIPLRHFTQCEVKQWTYWY
jgi:hypothetical protein